MGIAEQLNTYLTLSGALFAIGTFGFLARRNAISMLMSIELMLNAVNLAIVAFGAFVPNLQGDGAVIALMVMAVAAAEATVGWRSSSPSSATARRRSSTSTTRCADDGPGVTRPAARRPDHRAAAGRLHRHRDGRPPARLERVLDRRSARSSCRWLAAMFVVADVLGGGRRATGRGHPLARGSLRALLGRRRLLRRQPDRGPADRGHDDRHARPRLLDRVHAPRPGLLALLRLPQPVHGLDAPARPGRQLAGGVRGLGAGGPVQLPADRLLVPQADAPPRRARRRSSRTASATSASRSGSWRSSSTPGRSTSATRSQVLIAPTASRPADPDLDRRAADLRRRGRQERPVPAPRLAARRDGGPDAGLGPDPRRDDGQRRRLPRRPGQPDLRQRAAR